jgi:hypothetical protein
LSAWLHHEIHRVLPRCPGVVAEVRTKKERREV